MAAVLDPADHFGILQLNRVGKYYVFRGYEDGLVFVGSTVIPTVWDAACACHVADLDYDHQ
tara:strand:- start:150 stop:332 length:183 start_codon:yes stop_codon:yes gene_type:complete